MVVLELPFIFGSMPGREPLWAPMVRYLRSPVPLYCPAGGTNMIAVEHVAEALVQALESGRGGRTYTVGGENHSWLALMRMFCRAMDLDKTINPLPDEVIQLAMWSTGFWQQVQGLESGLNMKKFSQLFTSKTYIDARRARKALGYGKGGLREAIETTVEACPTTFYERLYTR